MAGMMEYMWGGYSGGGCGEYGFPFFGWGMMLIWLIIFLIIGYLVYRDANNQGMNGLLWWILILIPVVGIIFLILYIVLRETSSRKTVPESGNAMEILKERYAKGEITSEQFRTMREDLKK